MTSQTLASQTLTSQTLGSFTPINVGPAISSVFKEAIRSRPGGLNSDTLYELPDDGSSGSPAPKRRRGLSTKPARPKKTSTLLLTHPWSKANENGPSQLRTPPDSKKRSSQRSATQEELFPSANITKPTFGPMKLITTEDALKAKSALLGQTTMDKFASYRFRQAGHYPPDAKASIVAGRPEEIVDKPQMTCKPHINGTDHREEYHHKCSNQIGSISYPQVDSSSLTHDLEFTGQPTEEICGSIRDNESLHHDKECLYDLFGEDMLDLDDEAIFCDWESGLNKQEIAPLVQHNADDDFPVDDELETEMVQLLMPDKHKDDNSVNSPLSAVQNQNQQRVPTGLVNLQSPRPSSSTIVGERDTAPRIRCESASSGDSVVCLDDVPNVLDEVHDWPLPCQGEHVGTDSTEKNLRTPIPSGDSVQTMSVAESGEYSPLEPFARPGFPTKVPDRSPITGVSSSIILRTCFRIGEALREAALCDNLQQDAVTELFARVKDSSCDAATPSKLCFEFADLFHDRPPFIRGVLENNKVSSLQETESRMLAGVNGSAPMARCLGRLKRAIEGPPGWMLHIINIRPTDWEEVRWTRQIAGVGMARL